MWLEYPFKRLELNQVDNAEAIVVLSGEAFPGNKPLGEWREANRFLGGIKLFKSEKAPILIFTGSINPYHPMLTSEGDFYKKEAIRQGLDPTSVVVSSSVVNTAQEAKQVRSLIKASSNQTKKIILVTSAFHMKRAKRTFEKNNMLVQPYPVDFQSTRTKSINKYKDPKYWIPNAGKLQRSTIALKEILARFIYIMRDEFIDSNK